jgi:branched-chain amino acid transport system substrate-binding protein
MRGNAMASINRRRFLEASAAAASTLATPFVARSAESGTVKLGGLFDLSGNMQAFGETQFNVMKLAIDETNSAGGLLGKQIELVSYDTQSNNQLYGQYAQQLALSDKVPVVHGGLTSSSREVIRPILRRANTLYFYNMPYEGGVCDRNIFITGTTPAQLLAHLCGNVIKMFGKKIYFLAPDYNFGHGSAAWAKKIAAENGGEVVGVEFFPLDVNDFSATIRRIQEAKPDAVMNCFVGPAHAAFYGQWAAAGMKKQIPQASQTFGEVGEHKLMPPEIADDIMVCYSYIEEIDTPANQAFLKRFRDKYGTKYYISDIGMATYVGFKLWSEGVKKANSFERMKVIEALEAGPSVEGPSGKFTVDSKTHHTIFDMYLAVAKGGTFKILNTYSQVAPTDVEAVCDLKAHPETNQQFEPKT